MVGHVRASIRGLARRLATSLGIGDWRVIAADDYPSAHGARCESWHAPEEIISIAHAAVTHASAAGYTAHLYIRDVEARPSSAIIGRCTNAAP
jgi:hypothetical protein